MLAKSSFDATLAMGLLLASTLAARGELPENFAPRRLVAWCIVPFDAAQRTPEQRAAMLKRLGLTRIAYDWRAEHVPTFEREILAHKQRDIEFFAFWGVHDEAFALFKKHNLRPQIWQTLREGQGQTEDEKVADAARKLVPLARRVHDFGGQLGLYNHGGWGGEPENLVAVCRKLREWNCPNVGIVYNFHHAHGHLEDWPARFKQMKPYLLCLNLNGMNPSGRPKILPIGQGEREAAMLQTVLASGYDGPIGILDHRPELDAKTALEANLRGLEQVERTLAESQLRSDTGGQNRAE